MSWDVFPHRNGPTAITRAVPRKAQDRAPLVGVAAAPSVLRRTPRREAVEAAGYPARGGRDVAVSDLERYFSVNG